MIERFEWHYTPKHGSSLDMAESDLTVVATTGKKAQSTGTPSGWRCVGYALIKMAMRSGLAKREVLFEQIGTLADSARLVLDLLLIAHRPEFVEDRRFECAVLLLQLKPRPLRLHHPTAAITLQVPDQLLIDLIQAPILTATFSGKAFDASDVLRPGARHACGEGRAQPARRTVAVIRRCHRARAGNAHGSGLVRKTLPTRLRLGGIENAERQHKARCEIDFHAERLESSLPEHSADYIASWGASPPS